MPKPQFGDRAPEDGPLHPAEVAAARLQNKQIASRRRLTTPEKTPNRRVTGFTVPTSGAPASVTAPVQIDPTTPQPETAGAVGAAGSSGLASASDHIHPMAAGTGSGGAAIVTGTTASSDGVSASVAAADHTHAFAAQLPFQVLKTGGGGQLCAGLGAALILALNLGQSEAPTFAALTGGDIPAATQGDVTGGINSQRVVGIRDIPISAVAPTDQQALTYDAASGTIKFVTAASGGAIPTDYISGLYLSWLSTTTFQVGSGSAYNTSAGAVTTVAGAFTVNPAAGTGLLSGTVTLASATKYYVYLADATHVVMSTSAPSSYQGTAWQDASNRRYLGCLLTDGSSHFVNFQRVGNKVLYRVSNPAAAFQVLSGNAITSTSVSCSGLIPATSFRAVIFFSMTGTQPSFFGSSDGATPTTSSGQIWFPAPSTGGNYQTEVEIPISTSQAFLYCQGSNTGTSTVYVVGYIEDR